MKITELLSESIPLDLAKKYRKAWNPDFYKDLFMSYPENQRDRHGYRIYVPYEIIEKSSPLVPKNIKAEIKNKGYEIIDYIDGKARKINSGRIIKIGKLLGDQPLLQKQFNEDPQRAAGKSTDKTVVISRHPYDIAGMSTGRGWKSCMNLENGDKRHYVMHDVENGTIIAYLIHKNDKNIENPISRLLIKPFFYEYDPTDVLLASDEVQYGTPDENFGFTVQNWLNKTNGPEKTGMYCINPKLSQESKSKFYSHHDDSVHLEQVEEDPEAIKFIKHPTVRVQLAAVQQDGDMIQWIQHPNIRVQFAAVNQKPSSIDYILNPSPDLQIFAVERNPASIMYIEFPTEEAQLLAVTMFPDLVEQLENPSEKVIAAANLVKKGN
jgi:hypothetical protein